MKKKILLIFCCALPMIWSCKKDCDNLTNGSLTDEERKFLIPSSLILSFSDDANDTEFVTVDAPKFANDASAGDACAGNEFADQTYHFPLSYIVNAHLEHNNGDAAQQLQIRKNSVVVFKFDLSVSHYTEVVIGTQHFSKVLVDSVTTTTYSPTIRKIWYGQNTGVLQYEKWNGEIWRQN